MQPICFMYLVSASYVYIVHVPQKLRVWKHHTDHNRPDHHACKAETAVIFSKKTNISSHRHQPHFCQQECVMAILTAKNYGNGGHKETDTFGFIP